MQPILPTRATASSDTDIGALHGSSAESERDRFVRTARSECLDWLLIVNRQHLERVLRVFIHHYNGHRPHRSLDLLPPDPPPTLRPASPPRPDHVERRDRLGGLIRRLELEGVSRRGKRHRTTIPPPVNRSVSGSN
jgi:hypothetical protein